MVILDVGQFGISQNDKIQRTDCVNEICQSGWTVKGVDPATVQDKG